MRKILALSLVLCLALPAVAWAEEESAPRAVLVATGSVAAGDRIDTGPGASAVFTVGDSAYLVRENTRLELQGETPLTVRVLRLLSGAVALVPLASSRVMSTWTWR